MVDVLVSTEWLAEHLDDDNLRIFDCTVIIGYDAEIGLVKRPARKEYEIEHIPGASFLNLDDDLSTHNTGVYFMMPSVEQFDRVLSEAGLGNTHQVVLYSSTPVIYWATRMWWMLRASGFTNAAVLDGGLAKWKTDGFETISGAESYPPDKFRSNPDPTKWATKEDVLAEIERGEVCIVNTLSQQSFAGVNELNLFEKASYNRKGRIRGSVNAPYANMLKDDGTFESLDILQSQFEKSEVLDNERIIAYCGAGLSSTMAAFSLHRLGYENVAIYDGSLNEWGHDESLPMETD